MDQDDKDDWRREVLDAVRELDPTFLTAAIIDEMGKKLAAEGCGGALKDAPIALIGGMVSQVRRTSFFPGVQKKNLCF